MNDVEKDAEFYNVAEHTKVFKENLIESFFKRREDFHNTIQLAISEVELRKNQNPKLNTSIDYQLGKMAGYAEILEVIYQYERKKHSMPSITKNTATILFYLCLYDKLYHGELADMVGTARGNLTYLMSQFIHAGAVESFRSGRYVYYRLTDFGRQYYVENKDRLLEFVNMEGET